MGINVNLTPQLEDLVRAKVCPGMYTSESDVVREALRLMQEQDNYAKPRLTNCADTYTAGLKADKVKTETTPTSKLLLTQGAHRRKAPPEWVALPVAGYAGS